MSHTKKRPKGLVGYSRVSTEAQDLNRQRQALRAHGCKLIFQDKASGKSLSGRPQLAQALDELQPGDCLVLAEWDRATRSMWDGLHIVKHVLDAQATIRVLDFPSLDLQPLRVEDSSPCFQPWLNASAKESSSAPGKAAGSPCATA